MGRAVTPRPVPSPPREAAGGRSCDAGWCDEPSVGWRWFPERQQWLSACDRCMSVKGVPARHRHHDESEEDT